VCKVASHDQVKLRKHALPPSIHSFNRKGDKYKVYKYKVVSTILNDIYGIEIIYLEKSISKYPSHGQLGLMVLPPPQNDYTGCGATIAPKGLLLRMSAVTYSKISI
jgi:hypothetical protein